MNSMERIAATIKFEHSDRVPVIPQIFGHAAKLLKVPLRDYCCNGETLAKCQLHALAHYQYDAVFGITDVGVEAEALGSKLVYRKDMYPFVQNYAFNNRTNLAKIKVPNPGQDGRMKEIIKGIRLMRYEVNDETAVIGCVLGPITLATQLLGMEQALYSAADFPEDFERILDFCVKVQKNYGQAQLEAGAHAIMIFDPCASPEVIPPQFFREMELARIQEMFHFFKKSGSLASWLHIAGQAEQIFQYYSLVGVDIANFDYSVEPVAVQNLLPRICVNGNLKPLAFIEEEPKSLRERAGELVRIFSDRGGFILSSGCEIPPEAKPENVKAFVEAVVKEDKSV